MSTVRTYIDNLFAALPDSDAKERLHRNMLRDSEERYDDLLAAGHSEAEALGLVIQQFGDIKDLQTELGIEERITSAAEDAETARMVAEYRRFQPKFTIAIAAGVMLSIIGVVAAGVVGNLTEGDPLQGAWVILTFFIPVAMAVFIFIIFGMQKSQYTAYFRAKRMYEFLDEDVAKELRREELAAGGDPQAIESIRKNEKLGVYSGALWMGAIIVYLVLGFGFDLWHPGWLVFLGAIVGQMMLAGR